MSIDGSPSWRGMACENARIRDRYQCLLLAHSERKSDTMALVARKRALHQLRAARSDMLMRLIDWFWRDRHTGRIVIAQWPNLWLWIFAAASLANLIINSASPAGILVHIVAMAFLVIWAVDEMLRGVNPWRRCLGAAVLIGLAIKLVL